MQRDSQRNGFLAKLAGRGRYLVERYHDWRLGIDTLQAGEIPEAGRADDSYHQYHFTKYASFKASIRRLGIEPGREVLLDYGSGKGRAVIFAAEFPFRRVIGVELDPAMSQTASLNAKRARSKLVCKEIELVTADAAAYEVPPDVTVIYFYNPFHGHILFRVMDRIEHSLRASPRRLRIVYKNPTLFESEIARWPWIVKRDDFVHGARHTIYEALLEKLAR